MKMRPFLLLPLLLATTLAAHAADPTPPPVSVFQEKAAKFGARLTVPHFEQTPAEIDAAVTRGIAEANAGLDRVGKQDLSKVTFDSTVGALDNVQYRVGLLSNRIFLIQQTSPDKALRDAAEGAVVKLQQWGVGAEYREDVYKAVQAFDGRPQKESLKPEEARLLEFTLRDFRRAGLPLPPDQRAEVERLRKELTAAQTDFQANINASVVPMVCTRAELDGLPEDFLAARKTGDDQYTIQVNEAYQYSLVIENARREDTRHRFYFARENMARDKNVPLFNHLLELRNTIALKLGYKSWGDYQIENKMARTGAEAERFVDELIAGTKPKFFAECVEMQTRKAYDLDQPGASIQIGDPHSAIHVWDGRYYVNQIKKTRFNIDTEALRVYFPMPRVLDGMFRVYEKDFGLKITPVEVPYKWVPDLQSFVVSDAATDEPMGLFYLDMFPREGKFNHFAEFGIVDGKALDEEMVNRVKSDLQSERTLADASEGPARRPHPLYQRPVVCLVCNFPPPGKDGTPSLMTHDEVTTIFHEFGHALHAMLTRSRFGRFAGTNVPGDFVEAPSQMLENWAWDKTVLDTFAADYRDPSKKIPAEVLGKMREARLATAAVYYRGQLAYSKLDLVLHGAHPPGEPYDCVKVSNAILDTVSLPIDPGTALVAGFGHLGSGYEAGYYGYMWAEAIAADMATVFRNAPGGFMDHDAGMKLRTEIYQPGDSRPVADSIEKFLGRKRSIEPFLSNNLGIKPTADPAKKTGGGGPEGPDVK